ncbi:MAG: WG repeat-containing protein [Sphingobacteriales bacterium JAD_PAG50586_3]|nr:MAG: WG repeat-containing protein [Sphingobacteriales bacterium JAD_PAG50586_3]
MERMLLFILVCMIGNITINAQDTLPYTLTSKYTLDGKKFGLYDSVRGKQILPIMYDGLADYYYKGVMVYWKADKMGLVDTSNHVITAALYDDITDFDNSVAFIKKGEKYALINTRGVLLTQFLYDNVSDFSCGLAKVEIHKTVNDLSWGGQKVNDNVGYINTKGIQVIPCKYNEGEDCQYGLVKVKTVVDKIKSYSVDYLGNKTPNYWPVSTDYIYNDKGVLVYTQKENEKTITITPTGKLVVYMSYSELVNGGFSRKFYDQYKLYDPVAKITIIPYSNNWIFEYSEKYPGNFIQFKVVTGGRMQYGCMDYNGKVILNPNFKNISNFDYNSYAKVSFFDDTFFYIDKSGKCVEFEGVVCPSE